MFVFRYFFDTFKRHVYILVISEGIHQPPNQSLQANDHAVAADASGVFSVVVIAELER